MAVHPTITVHDFARALVAGQAATFLDATIGDTRVTITLAADGNLTIAATNDAGQDRTGATRIVQLPGAAQPPTPVTPVPTPPPSPVPAAPSAGVTFRTHHGTFLGLASDALVQVGTEAKAASFTVSDGAITVGGKRFVIERLGVGVALKSAAGYVCATDDGKIETRPAAGAWETFVPSRPIGGAAVRGRIRRDGRFLVHDGGTFRPRFVSALSILRPDRDDAAVRAYLDWAASAGANGIRVFAGRLDWAAQTPQRALERLPFLLAEAKARGLIVLITALTGTRDGGYDKVAHVRRCVQLCAGADHALLEIANETFHGTQDDEVHDPAYLKQLYEREVKPLGVVAAIGAPGFDEPQLIDPADETKGVHFPFPVADFVTLHLDRGRDKWNMARRVRELEAASSVTGHPVLNNEPIGADERDGAETGRQRINDPAVFFCLGALERIFEVGGVHHSQSGLTAELPGPVQQSCAAAYFAGGAAIPVEDRLSFKNTGWPDSPIASANFAAGALNRAYTGVAGDRAWTVLVGLVGDPGLQFRTGWRAVGTVAERPGVAILELRR